MAIADACEMIEKLLESNKKSCMWGINTVIPLLVVRLSVFMKVLKPTELDVVTLFCFGQSVQDIKWWPCFSNMKE